MKDDNTGVDVDLDMGKHRDVLEMITPRLRAHDTSTTHSTFTIAPTYSLVC